MKKVTGKHLFKRRKFTYRLLADSGVLYGRYCNLLDLTLQLTYKGCMTPYLKEYSYFSSLIHNIIAYNRCFYELASKGEIVAAYPLLRLVADNLKIMVAEYLYPEKILPNIFEKGKDLNQIKVNGEKLKPSDITKEVERLYPEFTEIYATYSCWVHPSKEGNVLAKVFSDDREVQKEIKHSLRTIKRTKAQWDLVKLNQYVVDTLLLLIERNKAIILESPELKQRYVKEKK